MQKHASYANMQNPLPNYNKYSRMTVAHTNGHYAGKHI
jgi:hypothetical protein